MPHPGSSAFHRHLTLAFCTLLHGLTHAYQVALVPLYLLIFEDLKLDGVKDATFIVTIYGIVYFLGSFIAGELADRYNRKMLLTVGLIGNALAVGLMGFTRQYEWLVAFGVLAGISGTFFHPAANAMVTSLYPRNPGMAIGWMGVGAGLGFFLGPQYAGWRAANTDFWWIDVAPWQMPCIELGVAGLAVAVIFILLVRESPPAAGDHGKGELHEPLGARLRWKILLIAPVLGLRDLAGVAMLSLTSIYLQMAHDMDTRQAGFILGVMMLSSVVANPVAVAYSSGRRRLPTLALLLVGAGVILATVPLWPVGWILPVLLVFQACQLATYSVADAAVLERVSPRVRGRVIGLWLTVAGTIGSAGPVFAGWWTDAMGDSAARASAYLPAFGTLAAIMIASAFSTGLISKLGPPITPVELGREIMPTTMEPVV